ncbi:hypothetical protein KBC59_03635 [Patescibacteria group bacterium]|jgi:hypothetical protein|nr:hypothetical protein [Patescibacteria group bacterium]
MKFESLSNGIPAEPNLSSEGMQRRRRLLKASSESAEFLKRGVFYDVYQVDIPQSVGGVEKFVIKDFRAGDVVKPAENQVALFQHQYYEWNALKHELGEKFFPESYWVRSLTQPNAHAYYEEPGKTPNTMNEFLRVQVDRQLADRYGSDDAKKGTFKKLMGGIGKMIRDEHADKPFVGAILQHRVNGLPFSEALSKVDANDPATDVLKENVRELIRELRRVHSRNETAAFTWHGLESDNVVAEVDEKGRLTGGVKVLDANFTERPNEVFRQKVLQKLEKDVFDKLERALNLLGDE